MVLKPFAMSVLLFGFTCCISKVSIGQEIQRSSINSAGSSSSSNNLYLSQSIGQPSVVGSLSTDKTLVRQGFQQPVLLSNGKVSKNIQLTIYPNPNHGTFYLSTNLGRNEAYHFIIYDLNGKLITSGDGIGGIENKVELNDATQSGSYYLNLTTEEGLSGQAKIIVTH